MVPLPWGWIRAILLWLRSQPVPSGVRVCPPLVTVAAQWWSLRRPCHTHPGCTRAVEGFRRARTCGPEALLGGGHGVPCVPLGSSPCHSREVLRRPHGLGGGWADAAGARSPPILCVGSPAQLREGRLGEGLDGDSMEGQAPGGHCKTHLPSPAGTAGGPVAQGPCGE